MSYNSFTHLIKSFTLAYKLLIFIIFTERVCNINIGRSSSQIPANSHEFTNNNMWRCQSYETSFFKNQQKKKLGLFNLKTKKTLRENPKLYFVPIVYCTFDIISQLLSKSITEILKTRKSSICYATIN